MNKNDNHKEEVQNKILPKREKLPHWRYIHHSWTFWIFLILMFFAIMYYVVSINFAFAPQKQMEHPMENNMTP